VNIKIIFQVNLYLLQWQMLVPCPSGQAGNPACPSKFDLKKIKGQVIFTSIWKNKMTITFS